MSKKMTRPSSKPGRPTPHWSIRARPWPGLARCRFALAAGLGVDDDLGPGPVAMPSIVFCASATVPGERMPA